MALINCPACEKEVSPNAVTCPNCGEPLKDEPTKTIGSINPKDPVHFVGIVIAVAIVIWLLYLLAKAIPALQHLN